MSSATKKYKQDGGVKQKAKALPGCQTFDDKHFQIEGS